VEKKFLKEKRKDLRFRGKERMRKIELKTKTKCYYK